jgi:hypothetical protein
VTILAVLIACLTGIALLAVSGLGVRETHRLRMLQGRAPARPEPASAPQPRAPLDLDRPYPRPKGARRKLASVCPVCGTGRETAATYTRRLDGEVLGWPAHLSCAEWLGDWKPAGGGEWAAEPAVIRRSGSTNTIHYAGGAGGSVTGGAGGTGSATIQGSGIVSTGDGAVNLQALQGHILSEEERITQSVMNGFISLGEAAAFLREQMPPVAREACPDCGMEFTGTATDRQHSLAVHRVSHQCEQRQRYLADRAAKAAAKPPPPVFPEWCTCGFRVTGTGTANERALAAHRASGDCPHSAKGRP